MVESRLTALVDGDTATISEILAQLALDKVGYVLTAHDIWHHLESRGYQRRNWGDDPHVLAKVASCNEAYLNPLRRDAIAGNPIPRTETVEIREILNSPSGKRTIMLVGDAGVGKSGVINLLATVLGQDGWPFLAFRVDRLEPMLLPVEVGKRQLDLPGSPANVLAAVAQGKKCILLIDQLDAVSLVSGRHPNFFDCIHAIIREALSHPNMYVLLACRKFDLQNDPRFRQLTEEKGIARIVKVNPLNQETVRETIERLGVDTKQLNEKQLKLLSFPLHLSLLASITESVKNEALTFATIRDLYDSYWDYKRRAIRNRRGQPVKWGTVIDSLCDFMSEKQVLYVPRRVIEDVGCSDDADYMISEHILIYEQKRYLFFHESFFDYAFARRFGARGHQLVDLLLNNEQHLFRRTQVRQILSYEREADFSSNSRYLEAIRELLCNPKIRFHIKSVILAILAQLKNPTRQEWEVLEQILEEDNNALTEEIWRTLYYSLAWVQLLHSLGVIKKWLTDDNEEHVNRAVTLLKTVQKEVPDLVAELAEPFVDKSERWNNRLLYLMHLAKLSKGRRFFDLFLRLIDAGLLDDAKGFAVNSDFWSSVYSLPKENPEWACEVIRHRLDRLLELSLAAGQSDPFQHSRYRFSSSGSDTYVLTESARGAPLIFITQILPFMLTVIRLNLLEESNPSGQDRVWYYRPYGKVYGIDSNLLQAMEIALSLLSSKQPQVFEVIADELAKLDYETIQFLLIRGYAANGSAFADVGIDYLIAKPSRLQTGYSSHDYWATRELIAAVTPHCSETHLNKLEEVLLNYYPDDERDKEGYKYKRFGYAQFVLLEAIIPARRSEKVIKRLREHHRSGKFHVETVNTPPKELEFRSVPPPIPEVATEKMTNKQWLSAIAQYNKEGLLRFPGGQVVEGADGLASILIGPTQRDPKRFASLLLKFPEETHWLYFNAVLQGISEAELEQETLLEVCKRCHCLPDRPCGRSIADLIAKSSRRNLLEEFFEILAWYATEDPDPRPGHLNVTIEGKDPGAPESIFTNGINSVRGRAAEAIAALIFSDPQRCGYFLPILQRLVKDPSVAVKVCVAEALVATLNYNRDIAVQLFIVLCENEEALLGTNYVERFLYYATSTHFDALKPVLEKMLQSQIVDVVTTGARQICLASLNQKDAIPFTAICIAGNESQQLGAAEIFAANLKTSRFRSYCEEFLVKLFNSPHETVQSAASHCFDRFTGDELGEYTELLEAFVNSNAFGNNYYGLLHILENTTAKLPDVTVYICRKFLDWTGISAGDIQTRAAGDSDLISKLIIRIYSQSKGDETIQSQCLDIVDRMAQIRAHGLSEALSLFER